MIDLVFKGFSERLTKNHCPLKKKINVFTKHPVLLR